MGTTSCKGLALADASDPHENPPGTLRLKRRADFLRVARKGRKWVTPGLVLQAWARPDHHQSRTLPEPATRVGFTVTKKVGNAVVRNRVKRRLRAAVDAVLPQYQRDSRLRRHDLVVIGRQTTLDRTFTQLLRDLEKALKRLDVCGP